MVLLLAVPGLAVRYFCASCTTHVQIVEFIYHLYYSPSGFSDCHPTLTNPIVYSPSVEVTKEKKIATTLHFALLFMWLTEVARPPPANLNSRASIRVYIAVNQTLLSLSRM